MYIDNIHQYAFSKICCYTYAAAVSFGKNHSIVKFNSCNLMYCNRNLSYSVLLCFTFTYYVLFFLISVLLQLLQFIEYDILIVYIIFKSMDN